MLIESFLRHGGSLADLEDLKIKIKRHPKYPNLIQLKYDQKSPMGNALVQNCRGVILDENDDWRCIARPFKKFFNEGEGHAAQIDWNRAHVQEKLDGSLMILYWYDNQWHVASSGTPDAGGEVNGYGFSFADLFWKTIKSQKTGIYPEGGFFGGGSCIKEELTVWDCFLENDWRREYTLLWELTSPYNKVVVQYPEPRVHLIGIIHTETGQEYPVHTAQYTGLPVVRSFNLRNLEAIQATFPSTDPTSQEGYVVVDHQFNRIKVKNPRYVALHHARDGFGMRRMLEIARGGETGEWLAYFPEFKDCFQLVEGRFNDLVTKLESEWERHKHIEDQKAFALAIKDVPCSGALFTLRRGKVNSIIEFLRNMNISNLIQLLNLKDDPA